MITVIGLGNERGDLTERAKERILRAAQEHAPILVRTANTRSYQSVLDLGVEHTCLDYIYEKSRNFQTLNKNLASAVVSAGENAVYLVDGSAGEDNSVKELLRKKRGGIEIISGVSKLTPIIEAVNFKNGAYTAVSAYELCGKEDVRLNLPLIVYDIDDASLASDCKLLLGDLFGEELTATYLVGGKAKKLPLYELDRQKRYDYTSAVAIDEIPLLEKTRFAAEDLNEIIKRLRAPDGCPWDRVQTSASIKMSAVEEAYELVDAIDAEDDEKILEETGDVLMQAAFHALLKTETGAFNWTDVVSGICQKLITRHTHVFGKDRAENGQDALSVWEKNKMTEKHQTTFGASVNDVPKCFPAAMRAQKIGKRAAKAGMDFSSVEAAERRLQEELAELDEARKTGSAAEIEKELGDVLFSVVNIGRKAGCDCEKALKESAERFAKRFTLAEQAALADGKEVTKLSESEWDFYYLQAKKNAK